MAVIPIRVGLIAAGVLAVAAGGSAVFVTHEPAPAPASAPAPVQVSSQAAADTSPSTTAPATAPAVPSFDVVRVAPSGSAVLAGRSEPMATVTVQSNGSDLGQVRADGRGEWVFLPTGPLSPGPQQLTLVARDAAGNAARSTADVVLVVPDRPPPPPSAPALAVAAPPGDVAPFDAPLPAAPEPVVAVLAPQAGPMRILQGPAAAPGRLALNVVDYDAAGQIRFAGASLAGTPVRVYVDNAAVGDARADKDGHWTLEPGKEVKPGVHALRVDQIGDNGQVISRVEMPFQRADLPALEPGRVVVQPGQNLWRIARVAYGTGVRYTVIYRANRDQIRDPRRIYPGQAFDVPAAK